VALLASGPVYIIQPSIISEFGGEGITVLTGQIVVAL
jgi:hypothetical protein